MNQIPSNETEGTSYPAEPVVIPDPDDSNPELLPVKTPAPVPAPAAPKTPQEMRVSEVSEALLPAYQKASTLELTDEEISALTMPFPDGDVEIRPHDGLIYIPHIIISNRFNQVFKPGKWALIRRREWYSAEDRTMYGEYVLLVRGCYMGESIGGHPYIANNPKQNYSDALEATAGETLRRIAAKRLGCGSQVWEPSYVRSWVARYAEQFFDRGKSSWRRKAPTGSPAKESAAPEVPTPRSSGPAPTEPEMREPVPEPAPAPQPRTQVAPGQMHPEVALLDNEQTVRLRRVIRDIQEPAQGKKARRVFFEGDPTPYFTRHKLEAIHKGDNVEVDIVRSDWQGRPMYWVTEWKGV